MKMLTLVFRENLEDYIRLLFNDLEIKGYTVITGAGGSGETGAVSGRHEWTDRNTLFIVTLDDARMATLVDALKKLPVRLVEEQQGLEVPLKAFLQTLRSDSLRRCVRSDANGKTNRDTAFPFSFFQAFHSSAFAHAAQCDTD